VTSPRCRQLEQLADKEPGESAKIWDAFGPRHQRKALRGYERPRRNCLALSRSPRRRAKTGPLKQDISRTLKPNQTEVYFLVGRTASRSAEVKRAEIAAAPRLEVLLLTDPATGGGRGFWTSAAARFEASR